MNEVELAIIGSGIGASLIASLNKDKDLILFEKDKNLGGSASTFKRNGAFFNAGATTFAGYEDGHIVKSIFDKANIKPDIIHSHIAYRTIQNGKVLDRVENFEEFLDNLNKTYYHPNNRYFWEKIKQIDERFWALKNIYFAKYNLNSYLKTVKSVQELVREFGFLLFKSGESFINQTLPGISKEYRLFIDSQLLITLQTTAKNIPLLSMSLGLSYPFHKVFYANGGMGKIFDDLLEEIKVFKKEEIKSIKKENNIYRLISTKDEYLASKVVLNRPVFECADMFLDENIRKYYEKFKFNDQSAFVIYLKIDSKEEFLHHYQIILDKLIPNSISNAFFISFSNKDDEKLSKDGYSATISFHTKALYWKSLTPSQYEATKQSTVDFILEEFFKHFPNIKKEEIKVCFSASSKTFTRYISRANCGGSSMDFKSLLKIASCNTPFKGLYNIGDSVFAGQGWPGVALGVDVLNQELNRK